MQALDFFAAIKNSGIDFFCGVPDSLLKHFCACITDNVSAENHIIAANEGNALALAAGHYLATAKPALVYMQNSGFGNAVNPFLSLCDEKVYKIPALVVVGWRGEPGVKDEPQHVKQGEVTEALLKTLGIKYATLSGSIEDAQHTLAQATAYMQKYELPFVLLVKKNTFTAYQSEVSKKEKFVLSREEAVIKVAKMATTSDSVIVATTGHISRELYEFRKHNGLQHTQDLLTVGSMGHASSIALGIALAKPNKQVFCFDGDGALLMHMGSMPVIAAAGPTNYIHVVFNNEAHDSVGGQRTCINIVDLPSLALSCGYKKAISVTSSSELDTALELIVGKEGPVFLEIKVKCGARSDLGRPLESPVENKEQFMRFLGEKSAAELC
ncbi:MAG: phosphonopyruvate decarboxylase [Legionellales bacterium]|jgi:phosphonopyruvate decarboxylase|nr:phosphonopyruvate decarboxylase [Legionellales bacterium]